MEWPIEFPVESKRDKLLHGVANETEIVCTHCDYCDEPFTLDAAKIVPCKCLEIAVHTACFESWLQCEQLNGEPVWMCRTCYALYPYVRVTRHGLADACASINIGKDRSFYLFCVVLTIMLISSPIPIRWPNLLGFLVILYCVHRIFNQVLQWIFHGFIKVFPSFKIDFQHRVPLSVSIGS